MDFGTGLTVDLLWAALLGYAFGSIPFGLILTKLAGLGDVRAIARSTSSDMRKRLSFG